jgi:hypothetical protein
MEIIDKSINYKHESIYFKCVKYFLLFFIFFPYLTPVETPWSLQPYALFISIILLLSVRHSKINLNILYLLIVASISLFIAILTYSDVINSIRSIANYISLPIIIWALNMINPSSDNIKKFVKISAITYTLVGIIQLFILPGFLSFLVPHQGGAEELLLSGRGVSSLTPEPSYFGFIMLLYFFLGLLFKDKFLIILSFISIFILAQSITVISCLVFSTTIILMFKNKFNFIFTIFLIIVLIISLFSFLNSSSLDTRSIILMQNIITDGFSSTIDNDASATGRMFHITYPIISSFSNFLIPFGYNGLPNGDTRILSGIAGAIYELGFISFIMLYVIYNIVFNNSQLKFNLRLGLGIGLIIFILNANQIGMPVFCFVLSFLLYTRKLTT